MPLQKYLAPVVEPINAFFDKLKQVWDYLSGKIDAVLGFFGLASNNPEMKAADVSDNSKAGKQTLSPLMIEHREQKERERKFAESMKKTDPTGEFSRNMYQQMKAGNGAAGGAGGSSPVITQVTHAPTTNNVVSGGGGGGSTVILSPTPVRHADSTRSMIGY